MENCILCQIVNGRLPSKKIYEDKEVMAVLDINGANIGHAFIMPKEHYTIMEQVPSSVLSGVFAIANKLSKAMFDVLNIQGTNLFVSNGVAAGQMVAHFMVNVIPRKENDGVNLQWTHKQLTEEEMSTVELQLKDAIVHVPEQVEKKRKRQTEISEPIQVTGEDNYLLKQLRRIP